MKEHEHANKVKSDTKPAHDENRGSSGFCVGMFIPNHGMRLSPPQKNMIAIPNVPAFR